MHRDDIEMQKTRIMYADLLLKMLESNKVDESLKNDMKMTLARELSEIEKRM